MKISELVKTLELEEGRHFQMEKAHIPLLDSHLYTPLGRRLFDLYQKYKIETNDQRELEALCYLLTSFTLKQGSSTKFSLARILKFRKKNTK